MIDIAKKREIDGLLRDRNFFEAHRHATALAKSAPTDFDTLAFAADVALQVREVNEAIGYSNTLATIAPTRFESVLFSAWAYRLRKDFDRAEHALVAGSRNFRLATTMESKRLQQLGLTYLESGRISEAYKTLTKAAALRPTDPQLLCELGCALEGAGQLEKAREVFQRAVKLAPDYFLALRNLASAELNAGHIERALELSARARKLDAMEADNAAIWLLAATSCPTVDAVTLRSYHCQYSASVARNLSPVEAAAKMPEKSVLNVAYFSQHFRRFPLSSFVPHVMKAHDRTRVKVYAISTSPMLDEWSREYVEAADEFHDLCLFSDEDIDRRIRALGIDVVIDLSGYTAQNRFAVLRRHPAPLQISWLGYLVTTGSNTIDFHVTDAIANPIGVTEQLFSEQLLRLPDTQYCYRSLVDIEVEPQSPFERAGNVTFGVFSIASKMNAEFVQTIAGVLQAVPESKVRMLAVSRDLQATIRRTLEAAGVNRKRVEFFGKRDLEGYMKAISDVDIVLDAFPFVGGTTVCDALWMGVPVVAMWLSRGFGGAAGSVLEAAGLGDLVARDSAGYVQVAKSLAQDHERLKQLRRNLRQTLARSALMNPDKTAHDLEDAVFAAWNQKRLSLGTDDSGKRASTDE